MTGGMTTSLSNAQKRELKARAQKLEPVVKLGHAGLSEAFLKSMETALATHGLVKMKFTDFKEERKTLSPNARAARWSRRWATWRCSSGLWRSPRKRSDAAAKMRRKIF